MKYKERGGWFCWVLFFVSLWAGALSENHYGELLATIMAGVCLIFFRLERISNALADLHNKGGEWELKK